MDSTLVLDQSLQEKAFQIRKANFTNEITFFAPGLKSYKIPEFSQKNPRAFLPISITGSGCALDCDHCNTKILEPMIPIDNSLGLFGMCEKMAQSGTESVLISGGSMKNGQVPFLKHIDDISRIKDELGLRVIMHTGLVDEAMARGLRNAGVDGVAIDIIGSNETIQQVYHLSKTVDDFNSSLELLAKYGLSMRPHIILGLHYGKFLGEYDALDMIRKYPVDALILVILTPMHGTAMSSLDPPDESEVELFFQNARIAMPDSKILLGCARPGGDYKKVIDTAAVDAGLNGIAYPAEGIIEHSESIGLKPVFIENSCSCGVE